MGTSKASPLDDCHQAEAELRRKARILGLLGKVTPMDRGYGEALAAAADLMSSAELLYVALDRGERYRVAVFIDAVTQGLPAGAVPADFLEDLAECDGLARGEGDDREEDTFVANLRAEVRRGRVNFHPGYELELPVATWARLFRAARTPWNCGKMALGAEHLGYVVAEILDRLPDSALEAAAGIALARLELEWDLKVGHAPTRVEAEESTMRLVADSGPKASWTSGIADGARERSPEGVKPRPDDQRAPAVKEADPPTATAKPKGKATRPNPKGEKDRAGGNRKRERGHG